jgi:hypothetical protein
MPRPQPRATPAGVTPEAGFPRRQTQHQERHRRRRSHHGQCRARERVPAASSPTGGPASARTAANRIGGSPSPATGNAPASSRRASPRAVANIRSAALIRGLFFFSKILQDALGSRPIRPPKRAAPRARPGAGPWPSPRNSAAGDRRQPAGGFALSVRARFVDVRSETPIADQQAFFVHDLHLLEGGGVAAFLAERLVDRAHGAGAEPPQHRRGCPIRHRSAACNERSTTLLVCQDRVDAPRFTAR